MNTFLVTVMIYLLKSRDMVVSRAKYKRSKTRVRDRRVYLRELRALEVIRSQ